MGRQTSRWDLIVPDPHQELESHVAVGLPRPGHPDDQPFGRHRLQKTGGGLQGKTGPSGHHPGAFRQKGQVDRQRRLLGGEQACQNPEFDAASRGRESAGETVQVPGQSLVDGKGHGRILSGMRGETGGGFRTMGGEKRRPRAR